MCSAAGVGLTTYNSVTHLQLDSISYLYKFLQMLGFFVRKYFSTEGVEVNFDTLFWVSPSPSDPVDMLMIDFHNSIWRE